LSATRALAALPLLGALALGCTPAVVPPRPPVPAPRDDGGAATFARAEDTLLRALAAADARFASRIGKSPSDDGPGASGELVGGALDPFAFAARAQAIEAAARAFEDTTRAQPSVERDAALLTAKAEAARARAEADLTVYGADLLLAVALASGDASDPDRAAADDALLAERVGDVDDAFAKARAPLARRREVEDALDPFERLVAQRGGAARYPKAFSALAKLRETTGEARALNDGVLPEPRPVGVDLALAMVGERRPVDAILAALTSAETSLRARAEAALAALGERRADTIRAAVGKKLGMRAPCKVSIAASPLRSAASSPEREAGCLAVRELAYAKTPEETAAAWTMLHDHVAVATWALAFHTQRETLGAVRGRVHLLSLPDDRTKDTLLRRATLRPAQALGPGILASLVAEAGDAAVTRATLVERYGDAPAAILRESLVASAAPQVPVQPPSR
jgi:hypothetical protein